MNKICTDIKQSKKLIELGIDVNTADMYWRDWKRNTSLISIPHVGKADENDLPAWSLTALLALIPKYSFHKLENGSIIVYHECIDADNPLDAAFEMVMWLKENKEI